MLYLHIGVGKAGSSTIQNFLELNHKKLKEYTDQLNSIGIGEGWKLAAASGTDLAFNYWVKKKKIFTELEYREFLDNFWKKVELEVLQSNSHCYVASSEHIFSQYGNCAEGIVELRDRLVKNFGDVKIIFYCREQVAWAKSFYAQIIKGPSSGVLTYDQFVDQFSEHSIHWNYYNNLSKWGDAFGDDNIIVRAFDKSYFKNNNLVDDFMSIIVGSKMVGSFEQLSRYTSNVSPKLRRIELLRSFNRLSFIPMVGNSLVNMSKRIILNQRMAFLDRKSTQLPQHRDSDILHHIDADNIKFNERFLSDSKFKLPTLV
ncbi:MAG: hypothetical protein V7711_15850 [Pseudomonadales bacterium]